MTLLFSLRPALRSLMRTPAFFGTANALLALGIGSAAAIFSLVDGLLFRPLPYPDPEALVSVGLQHPILEGDFMIANDYLHLKEQSPAFSTVTSWRGTSDCDLTEANPVRLKCAEVEWTWLPTFGIQPLLGRNFRADEDRRSQDPTREKPAILSDRFWRSRFGASPGAVGQLLRIDGAPLRVIGVLPASFELPTLEAVDLLIPEALGVTRYAKGQPSGPVRVFGRLRPGVTPAQARERSLELMLEDAPPQRRAEITSVVRPLRDFQIHEVRTASWVLLAASLAILLMVAANIGNLLLARAAAREQETAVRSALGASRANLLRLALVEGMLVSLPGLALGMACSWVLMRLLRAAAPPDLPRIGQASIDLRVWSFAVAVTLGFSIVFALLPVPQKLHASRLLGERTIDAGWGGGSQRLRYLLLSAQVALSLTLLSSAALLLRSFWNLQQVAPGFSQTSADRVVTAQITVGPSRHPNSQARQQFFDQLAERLRLQSGIESVAIADTTPPDGFVHNRPLANLRWTPQPERNARASGVAAWRRVSDEYFATLGIPVIAGRTFEPGDSPRSMVLSETLARTLVGSSDFAQVIGTDVVSGGPPFSVLGVVADVKNHSGRRPDPEYYIPRFPVTDPNQGRGATLTERALHEYDGEQFLVIRSTLPRATVYSAIRAEAAALDPEAPVILATLSDRLAATRARPRFEAMLLSAFAGVALLVAAAGCFGLVRYLIAQRRREIGVRIALGATPARVAGMMVWQMGPWIGAGLVAGLAGSLAAGRMLGTLLFDVPPQDPVLFGIACLILAVVSAAASAWPTWTSATAAPIDSLRT